MSVEPAILFRSIEQLLHQGTVAGLDERALLERFASHRDGRALTVLIATHGPMVLGVCRRILHEPQDVEDAFQSTFIVLVRRAGSIRDPLRLGAWLHGVARRVALRARGQARKQVADGLERIAILEDPAPGPGAAAERAELLSLIDEEMDRLPQRYRDVLVLCDLEGLTYTEAAQRLRCPLGTVQSRLARGRKRLRARLTRKGIEPATSAAWLADLAPSLVPSPLLVATLGVCEAAWKGGSVPAIGLGLLEWSGTLRATARQKIAAAAVLSVALGVSLAAFGFRQPFGPGSGNSSRSPPASPGSRRRRESRARTHGASRSPQRRGKQAAAGCLRLGSGDRRKFPRTGDRANQWGGPVCD